MNAPLFHIAPVKAAQPLWPALCDHLERHNMARWVVDPAASTPLPGVFFLAARLLPDDSAPDEVGYVVGHLSLKKQPLEIPATPWSTAHTPPVDHTLREPGNDRDAAPLHELFVQTFAVDAEVRRRGIGRALQQAGLALARELDCYQVRSWSSLDKPANYALKLSLGFAAHPTVSTTSTGQAISGVYFVKVVSAHG